ncbi:MAG: IS110 family transposase [Acidobacteria bacterium]|nr:IS110 family transposase [Acidobacteriota bacterium]
MTATLDLLHRLGAHLHLLPVRERRGEVLTHLPGAPLHTQLSLHQGRLRNEAAFASLAGVSPLQTSSRNTIRHRLNQRGDRQLNMTFDIVTKVRMQFDEPAKTYVKRRTTEGLSYREIKRVLKRYPARDHFHQLQQLFS